MGEVARKLFRCIGLIFPILYFFLTRMFILVILSVLVAIFIFIEILRREFPNITSKYFYYFPAIAKEKEKKNISGTAYVLLSSLLTIAFFKKEIAIAALFFLILGDAAASLVGKRFGRIKIKNKTLEGTLACFATCFLAGVLLLNFGIQLNYYSIILGAAAASFAELMLYYPDDNLTIALFSALIMALFG